MLILLMSLSSMLLEFDPFEGVENIIAIAIGVFSLLLLALSITAFRKTRLKLTIFP